MLQPRNSVMPRVTSVVTHPQVDVDRLGTQEDKESFNSESLSSSFSSAHKSVISELVNISIDGGESPKGRQSNY